MIPLFYNDVVPAHSNSLWKLKDTKIFSSKDKLFIASINGKKLAKQLYQ
jgi:hypothetical protein